MAKKTEKDEVAKAELVPALTLDREMAGLEKSTSVATLETTKIGLESIVRALATRMQSKLRAQSKEANLARNNLDEQKTKANTNLDVIIDLVITRKIFPVVEQELEAQFGGKFKDSEFLNVEVIIPDHRKDGLVTCKKKMVTSFVPQAQFSVEFDLDLPEPLAVHSDDPESEEDEQISPKSVCYMNLPRVEASFGNERVTHGINRVTSATRRRQKLFRDKDSLYTFEVDLSPFFGYAGISENDPTATIFQIQKAAEEVRLAWEHACELSKEMANKCRNSSQLQELINAELIGKIIDNNEDLAKITNSLEDRFGYIVDEL